MEIYEKPIAELVDLRPTESVMSMTLTLEPGSEELGGDEWED